MALKETALSILIKAKDLASAPLAKFRGGVSDTDKQVDELGKQSDSSGKKVDKLGDSIDKTGTLAGKAKAGMSVLTGSIVALASTYLSINALRNALSGIINTGAQFEQLRTQISTLMGSIEAGKKATAWIKRFASTTPASLEGVTQGFIKLKAFGIDPMNGSYQAIVDQTSKLGFTQEKMEGIILAVGQAWTKQKLQGEEALQLIERGVPVWDLLAKATGRTAVELQNMATKGQLGRKEISLLIDEMGKASAGAAADQMNTWKGMISNLKDQWTNFVSQIADAGIFDFAKEQLKEILDTVGQMAKDGRLKAYAQQISNYLVNLATNAKSYLTNIVSELEGMTRTVNAIVGTFQLAFNAFTAGVKTIGLATTAQIERVLSGISKLLALAGLDEAAAKMRQQAEAMGEVSAAFKAELLQDADDIQNAWKKINNQPLDQAKNEIKDLSDTTQQAADDVSSSGLQVVNTLELIGTAATDAKKATQGITTSTKGIKEHLEALDKAAKSQKNKTEATDQDSKAVDKNTAATDKNTESVRANRGAALTLAGKTSAAWAAASEEMGAAYDRLTQGMANAVNKFGNLPRAAFSYVKDFAKAYWDAEAAAQRLQAQYTQQEQSLNNHLRALTDSEHVTEAMVNKAEQALGAYTLLGDQQLAPLRNAIATIKADMDQLTDSLESTVDSLRDELDRLNGDTVAIQDRAYQKERDRLKDLADKAKQQRNDEAIREAQEALRLLEQTYRIKRENAQNEQQNAQPGNSSNVPSRTVRLELDTNGQTIGGDFDSDEQARAFVNAVKNHRWNSA